LGTVGALGFAGGALAVASHYDPGTKRSLEFWRRIFPIFGHYRIIQLLNRDLKIMNDDVADKKFDELHERYSERVKDITFTMRGFYLKQAQLLSTQDDLVPAPYMTWVKQTQDNVPSNFSGTEAKEYMRLKLKEEQNVDFDELFSSWDDTPLGVASVGQVHKAVLRKTGETVAVKLLIPGMEEVFRSDLKTLKSFCSLAMPQHVSAFDEIEKQFGSGKIPVDISILHDLTCL
jgi:aarF domain-containing kinase